MSKLIVIHHADQDGFMAAFLLGVRHYGPWGVFPEMIPVQYGDDFDFEALRNKDVAIVDFSFPEEDMKKIVSYADKVLWVDHHKSSAAMARKVWTKDLYHIHHRVDSSACALVFEDIHTCKWVDLGYMVDPGSYTFHSYLELSAYVEDADLNNYVLPHSLEVNAYIRSQPMTISSYMELARLVQFEIDRAIFAGKAILQGQETQRDKLFNALTVQKTDLEGHLVAVTNTPVFLPYRLATKIVEELDPSVDYACDYMIEDGHMVVSFRSSADKMAVEPLAKSLGGGGHDHAAGAKIALGSDYAQFVLGVNHG
jgi:hypothetical protein